MFTILLFQIRPLGPKRKRERGGGPDFSGKEKGKRGKILHIDRSNDRVYVEGVNKIKRFMRPTQENPQGGVVEIEAPMHLSNVLFYDSKKKKGVKLGKKVEDGKNVRITRPEGKTV